MSRNNNLPVDTGYDIIDAPGNAAVGAAKGAGASVAATRGAVMLTKVLAGGGVMAASEGLGAGLLLCATVPAIPIAGAAIGGLFMLHKWASKKDKRTG